MPQPPVHDAGPPATPTTQTISAATEPTADENQEPQSATEGGGVRNPLEQFWQLEEEEDE